jgi:hypothetical protein
MELIAHMIRVHLNIYETDKLISRVAAVFCILLAKYKYASCSASPPAFLSHNFCFYFSQSNRLCWYVILFLFAFSWCLIMLNMFSRVIYYSHILFDKVSIPYGYKSFVRYGICTEYVPYLFGLLKSLLFNVLLCSPGWPQTPDSPAHSARITDVCHHAQ